MDQVVNMLNTKSDLPVTNSDVHRLLKYAIAEDDRDSEKIFDQIEHPGVLLYVTASHQKQLRSLIRNPAEYRRKCEELPEKHDFKVNPNLKSLIKELVGVRNRNNSKQAHSDHLQP